jgi:hypothetical protein
LYRFALPLSGLLCACVVLASSAVAQRKPDPCDTLPMIQRLECHMDGFAGFGPRADAPMDQAAWERCIARLLPRRDQSLREFGLNRGLEAVINDIAIEADRLSRNSSIEAYNEFIKPGSYVGRWFDAAAEEIRNNTMDKAFGIIGAPTAPQWATLGIEAADIYWFENDRSKRRGRYATALRHKVVQRALGLKADEWNARASTVATYLFERTNAYRRWRDSPDGEAAYMQLERDSCGVSPGPSIGPSSHPRMMNR